MTHEERMAEWRERNDAGDCGRVASEVLEYAGTLARVAFGWIPGMDGFVRSGVIGQDGSLGLPQTAIDGETRSYLVLQGGSVTTSERVLLYMNGSTRGMRTYFCFALTHWVFMGCEPEAIPPLEAVDVHSVDGVVGKATRVGDDGEPTHEQRMAQIADSLTQILWLYPNYEARARGPYGLLLEAINVARPEVAQAMQAGTWINDIRRRFFDDGEDDVECVKCGQAVESPRRCYAIPHCYACLPPPEPPETFTREDIPGMGKLPSERMVQIREAAIAKLRAGNVAGLDTLELMQLGFDVVGKFLDERLGRAPQRGT